MKKTVFYYHPIVFILVAIVLLTSCNLHMEKRRYRPGYHVEVIKRNNNEISTRKIEQTMIDQEVPDFVVLPVRSDSVVGSTDVDKPVKHEKLVTNKITKPVFNSGKKRKDKDSCDVIFTVTGERINARVLEITDEYVHYKLCDDPAGKLYSVKTKTIDNITLRNGEYFIPKDRVIIDEDKEGRKSKTLFVMAIVSASISVIAFTFAFFIHPFGIIAFSIAIINLLFSGILMLLDIKPGSYVPSFYTKLTWILALIAIIICIAAMVICWL